MSTDKMKTTIIHVTFDIIFNHDSGWSEEDLHQVARDLVSYNWPHGWDYDGIRDWHVENKTTK